MGKRVQKMVLTKTWTKLFIPFSSNLGCHPTSVISKIKMKSISLDSKK